MNEWLLEIIRCPISGRPLKLADQQLVERLRAQARAGGLTSHKGIAIAAEFEGGLVDQTEAFFYRIQDGIPSLLPDEAIKLDRT